MKIINVQKNKTPEGHKHLFDAHKERLWDEVFTKIQTHLPSGKNSRKSSL